MSFLSNDAKRYDYVFALRLYKLFYMLTWFFMPSYEGWLSICSKAAISKKNVIFV